MKTNQPSWHCIANLGDVTPLDYGGAFVLIDKRGIYCPELWIYDADEKTLSTVLLELCTRCPSDENSVSDNRFHADSPAWFGNAEDLESIAATSDMSAYGLRDCLQSACPVERAHGYLAVISHHGIENFDQYPDKYTRKEATELCNIMRRQIAAAANWKDGI